jgi:Domain of unknown function (DUF4159)
MATQTARVPREGGEVKRFVAALALALALVLPVAGDTPLPPGVRFKNATYDGRFTFARIRFNPTWWGPGNYYWGLDLKWNHDYPRSERHFTRIIKETTLVEPNLEEFEILSLDDPELFRYPWAYMCEVGFWAPTDHEAERMRAYLLKGGFIIVDDFITYQWDNFVEQMKKVFPNGRLIPVDPSWPVFDVFYKVDPRDFLHPYAKMLRPGYYGIFEDNDPSKRLMVMVHYNQDIGDYWEWSDTDLIPIALSNEAYKLGVNYVIYSMTH